MKLTALVLVGDLVAQHAAADDAGDRRQFAAVAAADLVAQQAAHDGARTDGDVVRLCRLRGVCRT